MSKVKTIDQITKITASITQTKQILKHQILQVVKNGPQSQGLMYFLEGEPGIGKTSIVSQVLDEVSKEILTLKESEVYSPKDLAYFKEQQKSKAKVHLVNLCAKDAQDLSGMPVPPELVDNVYVQRFSKPESNPSFGYGAVFYDEANRVFDIQMKGALLSMWMDRGINGNYLGNGYIQVAAGNNFDDSRFNTAKPDSALKERYVIIHVRPTFTEICSHLEEKHGDHFLLSYLKDHKEFCNLFGEPHSSFSPRSIDNYMVITSSIKNDYNTSENARFLIEANLKMYFGSVGEKIIEILNEKVEVTLKKIIENPSLLKHVKKEEIPLMTQLASDIVNFFVEKQKEDKKLTKKESEMVCKVGALINSESKGLILTKILANSNGNGTKLVEKIKNETPDLFEEIKKVKESWEKSNQGE